MTVKSQDVSGQATASHRLALMYASTLSLIFLVFGQALLVLLGILGTLTTAHALCNATLGRAEKKQMKQIPMV